VTVLALRESLIDVAEVDVDAIPLGTRGRVGWAGLKSLLVGSVSHAVVQPG